MKMAPYFPSGREIITSSASFDASQRIEACAQAEEKFGCGINMQVHSSWTYFYADPKVPVGDVEVWSVEEYKGILRPDGVIKADDPWVPPAWRYLTPDQE